MSLRGDPDNVVALTDIWTEGELIRRGTVLPAKHPVVKRCRDFFASADLVPALEPERMRELERQLWAKSTGAG
jgi:hypothetical protein